MNKTETYLREHFEKTRWPFLPLLPTLQLLGEGTRKELNELALAGKIKNNDSPTGRLIEIINLDKE